MRWINLILGLWLIVSPFVLGFSSNAYALWNNLIVGILVAVIASNMASTGAKGGVPTAPQMRPGPR